MILNNDSNKTSPLKGTTIVKSPVNDEYYKLFEENIPKLEEDLDNSKAWEGAANYYVKDSAPILTKNK